VRAVIGLTPTYLSIHDIRVRRGRRRFQAVSYLVSAVSATTGKRDMISYIYMVFGEPVLLSRPFFRSRDRDLGLQVSRPGPRPWPSGLETETETWTK